MKRVVIVCAMVVLMVAVSLWSLYRVDRAKTVMAGHIETALEAVDRGDRETLEQEIGKMEEYWKEESHTLVHYVRHAHIDEITRGVARLSSLAAFEDYSQLGAELSSIRWQIQEVWHSEQPTWENIL